MEVIKAAGDDKGKVKEICTWELAILDKLHTKLRLAFDDVGKTMKLYSEIMVFESTTISQEIVDLLPRIAEALPLFDKVQDKSSGLFVPWQLVNLRHVAATLKGMLLDMPKIADAVDGEYLDKAKPEKGANLAMMLDVDRLRGSLGDICEWGPFVENFRKCDIIKSCREMISKDIAPIATETKEAVTKIVDIDDFKGHSVESTAKVVTMAPQILDANIKKIKVHAELSGDSKLRAEIAHYQHVVEITRSVMEVVRWQVEANSDT